MGEIVYDKNGIQLIIDQNANGNDGEINENICGILTCLQYSLNSMFNETPYIFNKDNFLNLINIGAGIALYKQMGSTDDYNIYNAKPIYVRITTSYDVDTMVYDTTDEDLFDNFYDKVYSRITMDMEVNVFAEFYTDNDGKCDDEPLDVEVRYVGDNNCIMLKF